MLGTVDGDGRAPSDLESADGPVDAFDAHWLRARVETGFLTQLPNGTLHHVLAGPA